jgi:BirA family transcriptional regulator, biotin operon repressor / biotin---[acetyl-CoA-carboxylase] ligase
VTSIRVIARETIGSTNEEALMLARAGERGPLWISARAQSAGRGRRGRSWTSPPGNLYASLLLTDPSPPERAPELSFVAALAVYDAVAAAAPSLVARLSLKWPNDLLIGEKKFGGILIEAESSSPCAVVVGIGVNCAHHPGDTPYPATDLTEAGAVVAPSDLLDRVSSAMLARLAQWDRGAGFTQIRADWLARAAGLGQEICLKLADGDRVGRFETLDETGRLVLQLPAGTREAISAGDVVSVGRLPLAARQ